MGFSVVYQLGRNSYTQKSEATFFGNIVNRRLYNRMMNNILEAVNLKPVFRSWLDCAWS